MRLESTARKALHKKRSFSLRISSVNGPSILLSRYHKISKIWTLRCKFQFITCTQMKFYISLSVFNFQEKIKKEVFVKISMAINICSKDLMALAKSVFPPLTYLEIFLPKYHRKSDRTVLASAILET